MLNCLIHRKQAENMDGRKKRDHNVPKTASGSHGYAYNSQCSFISYPE